MSENKTRKELKMQYKERKRVGGVFAIRNTQENKLFIDAAIDLRGSRNRFEFAQKTGSCVDLVLQKDWARQGPAAFVFETLEELEKGELQTDDEFSADIKLLKEIWLEKLANENLY